MSEPATGPAATHGLRRVAIVAIVIAALIVILGIASRLRDDHALAATADADALPTVEVVRPERSRSGGDLTLPGNVQAYNSAQIYARTNGYVRRWLVDIGERVRAGQTLAIIDAPEVDQQVAAARADYQTALANQMLAASTAKRWAALLAKDAVSQQEADEKSGDLAAKSAVANAAAANVRRLRATQGFEQLKAPFAGTVTSRSAEIGALVTSGNAAAQPLFTISDVRRMRVYVRVPQTYSAQVRPGMHAALTVPEYPGRSFDAALMRTAEAVEAASGTVLVELAADGGGGALKPGAYAQVTFPLPAATGAYRVPSSALITRENGTQLAIVDGRGRVALRSVRIARDDGATIEIAAGLGGGERVIDTPPDALENGDRVRMEMAPAKPAGGR